MKLNKLLKRVYQEVKESDGFKFHELVKHLLKDDLADYQYCLLLKHMNNIASNPYYYIDVYKPEELEAINSHILEETNSDHRYFILSEYVIIHRRNFNRFAEVKGKKLVPEDKKKDIVPRQYAAKLSNIKLRAKEKYFDNALCKEILELSNEELYIHEIFKETCTQGTYYKHKKGS